MLVKEIVKGITTGEKSILAKFITMLEKENRDEDTIAEIFHQLPTKNDSIRIGLSGPPGVGKSSTLNELCKVLVQKNHKIAVLAVDPSSSISGGSILGDKTRMGDVSSHKNVYIRPSPSRTHLGGVHRATRECIMACEAAGYNWIFVETVGVGQSETKVFSMTDVFVTLLQPATGDQLQGMKKGLLELPHIISIHKADGDLQNHAAKAKNQLEQIFHMMEKPTKITTTSIKELSTMSTMLEMIENHYQQEKQSGLLAEKRTEQEKDWLQEEINFQTLEKLGPLLNYDELIKSDEHIPKLVSITLKGLFK